MPNGRHAYANGVCAACGDLEVMEIGDPGWDRGIKNPITMGDGGGVGGAGAGGRKRSKEETEALRELIEFGRDTEEDDV